MPFFLATPTVTKSACHNLVGESLFSSYFGFTPITMEEVCFNCFQFQQLFMNICYLQLGECRIFAAQNDFASLIEVHA